MLGTKSLANAALRNCMPTDPWGRPLTWHCMERMLTLPACRGSHDVQNEKHDHDQPTQPSTTHFINHDWSEALPFLNINKYDDLWFKIVLLSLKLLQLAPSRNSLPPSASVLSWCWGKVSSVQSCWHFGWKKGGWWKADRHAVLSYT